MTFEIELPPDVEAFYTAEASARGLPLHQYIVERLIATASSTDGNGTAKGKPRRLNLPELRGSIIGSLRRRDIYDDRG
jgi:hypothetical protein